MSLDVGCEELGYGGFDQLLGSAIGSNTVAELRGIYRGGGQVGKEGFTK